MKKVKTISILMLVVLLVSAMAIPAMAYRSGDREVYYYNFSISNGNRVGTSSSSMERLYNREWVVTVSEVDGNQYPITYGMLWMLGSDWDYCLASNTTTKSGRGNFGATYGNTTTIGWDLWLGALTDVNDVSSTVITRGQWSTDAYQG